VNRISSLIDARSESANRGGTRSVVMMEFQRGVHSGPKNTPLLSRLASRKPRAHFWLPGTNNRLVCPATSDSFNAQMTRSIPRTYRKVRELQGVLEKSRGCVATLAAHGLKSYSREMATRSTTKMGNYVHDASAMHRVHPETRPVTAWSERPIVRSTRNNRGRQRHFDGRRLGPPLSAGARRVGFIGSICA